MASIRSKILLAAVLPIGLCVGQVGPTGGGGGGAVGPRGATGPAGPAPAGTGAVVVNNGVASAVAVSGDGTLNPATGALTVTKKNGTAFAAVATSGSAADLSAGTLPHARLPVLLAGDIPANAANTSGNAATATALASAPTLCAAGSYTLGIGITGNAQNCTALPTFPAGTIVGTSDTQTLTNKTVDGVSPATMAFLDATSSIQSQLNSKATGNPGTCAIVATAGTLTLTEGACTNGGTGGTATATGSAPFTNFEINGGNQSAITVSINGWTTQNHSLRVTQGGSTVTTWTWPGTFSPAPSVYPAVGQSVAATGFYDGSTWFLFLGPSTSGIGFGAEVTAPTCSSGVLPPAGYYLAWADSTDHTIHYYSSTCVKSSYVKTANARTASQYVTYVGPDGSQNTAQPAFSDLTGTASFTQLGSTFITSGAQYSNDDVCNTNVTIGSITCTSNVGTTATTFAHPVYTFGGAGTGGSLDGTAGRFSLNFSTLMEFVGAGSGNMQWILYVCPSTWTAGSTAGCVALWKSQNATQSAATNDALVFACSVSVTGTATTLIGGCNTRQIAGFLPNPAQAAGVPNSVAGWVIVWGIAYGNAANTGNGVQLYNNVARMFTP